MAAIDKIYGTHDEWIQLRDWLRAHYPHGLERIYPEPPADGEEYHLSNFDVGTDMFLRDHCDIPFVRDSLRKQGYEVGVNPVKLLLKRKRAVNRVSYSQSLGLIPTLGLIPRKDASAMGDTCRILL